MNAKCMKRLFVMSMILGFLLFAPTDILAQSEDYLRQTDAFAGTQGANLGTPRDPRLVAAYIIQVCLTLIGTLFTLYAVYAGYTILMARGNEEKVTKGKETLKTAIIGLVIILSAYSITRIAAYVATNGKSEYEPLFRDGERDIQYERPGFNADADIRIQEDYSNFINRDPGR